MTITEWIATAPAEIIQVFQSVDVRNFLKVMRNTRFQMAGKYDGSISEECKRDFELEHHALHEFLEATRPNGARLPDRWRIETPVLATDLCIFVCKGCGRRVESDKRPEPCQCK